MKLPWRRRPAPAPRSNPLSIAVLEAEELRAAMAVWRTATCCAGVAACGGAKRQAACELGPRAEQFDDLLWT